MRVFKVQMFFGFWFVDMLEDTNIPVCGNNNVKLIQEADQVNVWKPVDRLRSQDKKKVAFCARFSCMFSQPKNDREHDE